MKALLALLHLHQLLVESRAHVISRADDGGSHDAHIRRVEVDHSGSVQNEVGTPTPSAELVQEKSGQSKDRFIPPLPWDSRWLHVSMADPANVSQSDLASVDRHAQPSLHMQSFLGGIVVGLLIAVLVAALMSSFVSLDNMRDRKRSAPEATAGSTDSTHAGSVNQPSEGSGQATRGGNREEAHPLDSEFGAAENLHLFWPRCAWLAAMLLIQSISSFILSRFQSLVDSHDDLLFFLTMLVGLGGNAGGQSVVLAVRRLAKGERDISVPDQVRVGFLLGCVLGPLAFLRAIVSGSSTQVCLTIGLSAGIVVIFATGIGTAVPKVLNYMKSDAGQASSMIQVLMDIIGISVVCGLGMLILQP